MTNRPNVSYAPSSASFAERIKKMEEWFVAAEMTSPLFTDMLACIREQRAALEAIELGYTGTVGNCEGLSGAGCAEIARAALTKWRLK